MAGITITHSHEEGTKLTGSNKGDGVLEIVRANGGFSWRRYSGIHIAHSRDKDARTRKIGAARKALEEAGHTVTVEIDNTPRTAAEREADRAGRVERRVERLEERAGKAASRSDARLEASRAITDGIPFGQPVQPPGHHSRAGHLRALERSDNHMRKSIQEAEYAERLASRAEGAAALEAHKQNPRAIMRRIEELEAEGRRIARSMEGYERNSYNGRGEVVYVEKHDAATGEWAERLKRRAGVIAEDVAHQRAKLAAMEASGEFVAWGPDDFRKGDEVKTVGGWLPVRRVNTKSVSVPGGYGMAGVDSSWNATAPWDKVRGRRRDGMQWDTPNGEPWPVELAQRVAQWRELVQRASRASSYDDESRRLVVRVNMAQCLVRGLPATATAAEVAAFGKPETATDRRALADQSLSIFERLEAGERATDIAATVTPFGGDPSWRMPDGEPVDVMAHELRPGDIIAGLYDSLMGSLTGGKGVLCRSFVGPVAYVSPIRDRREADEWVTVRLVSGQEAEMRAYFRRVAVFPAGVKDASKPAEPPAETPTVDEPDPETPQLAEQANPAGEETKSARQLVARRIPEIGCAVYDKDTGQKVSPEGNAWWPNMRRASQALTELLADEAPPAEGPEVEPAPVVDDPWAELLDLAPTGGTG